MKRPRLWQSGPTHTQLVAILCGFVVASSSFARPLNLLDVARVRHVTSASLSPDGRHIAYTRAVPRRPFVEDDGPAWQELHVIGPEQPSRPFITGAVRVSNVQWRPNTREISFLQQRPEDEKPSLYVIAIDGGEARRVLKHPTGVGTYAWSPTGLEVAFLATETEPKQQTEDQDKGFAAKVFEEDWLPTKVWIASPQEGNDPWVTNAPPTSTALPLLGSAHALEWSPDGLLLAIALAPTPSVDDELMRQRIQIIDLATRSVTGTVETPGKLGAFRWSPNSQSLALIATTDVHDPLAGRLLVASREGGVPKTLAPNYPGHFTQVEWLDDQAVLALSDVGVWNALLEVRLNGEINPWIKPGEQVVTQFALHPGSHRIALLLETPGHPTEVFELLGTGSDPTRRTDSNPWLAEVDLARQEIVRHKARDGLELEGILVRPLNEEGGRRYPLILVVHGGPESHQVNGWLTTYSRLGQAAAAQGFAVFYPNYRGSTGRGVAFSMLGQSDYAGGEFNDLVDAVEHLVKSGLADSERVGVTGGSYGGYATAWCSTKLTEHFAAGVMFVGISDHIAKFGTTDIPNEMVLVHARKYPWEDWRWFLERSPIRYAGQGRTPLLILHGQSDTRVHPSQSRELYRYLKTHGQVPVRLVEYPGEGHGNRNAAARLDYSIRALRWFQHYLQGPRGEPPPYTIDLNPYRPASTGK